MAMKNIAAAIGMVLLAMATSLCLVAGGCRKGQDAPTTEVLAETGRTEASGCVQIGRDPGRIARLEQPAMAVATVFDADGGERSTESVVLLPGTWLLPEGTFTHPEAESSHDG